MKSKLKESLSVYIPLLRNKMKFEKNMDKKAVLKIKIDELVKLRDEL